MAFAVIIRLVSLPPHRFDGDRIPNRWGLRAIYATRSEANRDRDERIRAIGDQTETVVTGAVRQRVKLKNRPKYKSRVKVVPYSALPLFGIGPAHLRAFYHKAMEA